MQGHVCFEFGMRVSAARWVRPVKGARVFFEILPSGSRELSLPLAPQAQCLGAEARADAPEGAQNRQPPGIDRWFVQSP